MKPIKTPFRFLLLTSLLSVTGGYLFAQRYAAALSPAESRKTFQLDPAFDIEPFLAEPQVLSPVDSPTSRHEWRWED